MAPDIIDEAGFDRFVSDHDTAVIGFIEDGDAAVFFAFAPRHGAASRIEASGAGRRVGSRLPQDVLLDGLVAQPV